MWEQRASMPGRRKFLVCACFWTFASTNLFLAYLTNYFGPAQKSLYYHHHKLRHWATPALVSVFGVMNAMGWLLGFAVNIDWLTYDDVKRKGYVQRGVLWGVILKEIASVLFNVQPWSYLTDKQSWYLDPRVGVPWSNLIGIIFYLSGNCVELCFLAPHWNFKQMHPNLNIIGTFFAMSANWFITVANAWDYFNLAGTDWAPPTHPSVAPYQRHLVVPFQLLGAILLIIGSLMQVYFALTCNDWIAPEESLRLAEDDYNQKRKNSKASTTKSNAYQKPLLDQQNTDIIV